MKPQDLDGSRKNADPADVFPPGRYEPDLTGQPDWLPQINREPGVHAFEPHDRGNEASTAGSLFGGVWFLWLANPIGNGQAKRE